MGHNPSKHHTRRQSTSSQFQTPRISTTNIGSVNIGQKYDLSKFAVITVIFNPIKYQTRYDHYKKFATHIANSGVQLITVECIFESTPDFGLPRQYFHITDANDRHHIQLVAPSIIWMKENLINIAVQRLPQNIEYIAWIDADIEFERLDWPHLAIAELQRYSIVQLFEVSFFLGPGGKNEILRRDHSFGYSIRHNKPINPQRYDEWYAHPGYAWAMRRSAFNSIGGLIDFCIIGSGDLHFAFALLNRTQETIRPNMHQDYKNLVITWGQRVAQIAQNGTNVGYAPVNLWHHWHGERNNRNYVNRWMILENHQFSPLNDLEKNNDTGLLRLINKNNLKYPEMITRIEQLERDIVAYFKSRNEDSTVTTVPPQQPPVRTKPPVMTKPHIAPKIQTHRGPGAIRTTAFPPNKWSGNRGPIIWSSGPAGIHVDDHDPYLDHCTCPGHHHHHDNHDCPCSPHHTDDQHCWNPSEHEHHHHHHPDTCIPPDEHDHHHDDHHHHHDDHHHHHHDEYHHHHTDDHFGGHHSHDDHGHHADWSNVDNSGSNYDYSSGGGGFDYHGGSDFGNTDYGGPGSFY